jgi:hypothetical protein
MFRLEGLILGAFASAFASLRAFVLEPDFHPSLKCFLGRPI